MHPGTPLSGIPLQMQTLPFIRLSLCDKVSVCPYQGKTASKPPNSLWKRKTGPGWNSLEHAFVASLSSAFVSAPAETFLSTF
jgi:hypothetical protein